MYKKIQELMKERGISPYMVAKSTGIAPVSFTEWKQGKYKPSLESLKKLAEFFGVPMEYFFE